MGNHRVRLRGHAVIGEELEAAHGFAGKFLVTGNSLPVGGDHEAEAEQLEEGVEGADLEILADAVGGDTLGDGDEARVTRGHPGVLAPDVGQAGEHEAVQRIDHV